jgi:hypothetical protein
MAVVGLDAKIVQDFADKLTKDLATSVNASGVNASGNLAKSFRYELQPERLRVFAAKYYSAIEIGRKQTVNGGDGVLRGIIRRWIDQKGITPKPDANGRAVSKDSLAFLITRKIHREGTLLNSSGKDFQGRAKPTGIITGVINDGRLDSLKKQLITSFVFLIKQDLKNVSN